MITVERYKDIVKPPPPKLIEWRESNPQFDSFLRNAGIHHSVYTDLGCGENAIKLMNTYRISILNVYQDNRDVVHRLNANMVLENWFNPCTGGAWLDSGRGCPVGKDGTTFEEWIAHSVEAIDDPEAFVFLLLGAYAHHMRELSIYFRRVNVPNEDIGIIEVERLVGIKDLNNPLAGYIEFVI